MSNPGRIVRKMRSLVPTLGLASSNALQELESHLNDAQIEIQKQQSAMLDEMRIRWREEDELIRFLARRAKADIEAEKISRARPKETQKQLTLLRESPNYSQAWDAESPLVSVRIASYRNTEALIERAIPSVLSQTHRNLEIIVVNDGPNERTREAIGELNNPLIHYEEFPERSRYPEDEHLRWMVAGSPGMNRGAALAKGDWIAPLDDDDEFEPDHIEKLLNLARSERAEFAYGAIEQHRLVDGDSVRIFSDPPQISQISMQSAIYHSGLRFMDYDTESWRVDEPGDWNLIRRMKEIGVRMKGVDEIVTSVFMLPYNAKS